MCDSRAYGHGRCLKLVLQVVVCCCYSANHPHPILWILPITSQVSQSVSGSQGPGRVAPPFLAPPSAIGFRSATGAVHADIRPAQH